MQRAIQRRRMPQLAWLSTLILGAAIAASAQPGAPPPAATVVTALFDIGREAADGRSIGHYLDMIKRALELKAPFVAFIQSNLADRVQAMRDSSSLHVVPQALEDLPYYAYVQQVKAIQANATYKQLMMHPDRVECRMPLYALVQFSKFEWVVRAARLNLFNTSHFQWLDAGASRFYEHVDIGQPWPLAERLPPPGKVLFQAQPSLIDLHSRGTWNTTPWVSSNFVMGGTFGGNQEAMERLALLMRSMWERMLSMGILNNEQILVALVWHEHPTLFHMIKWNGAGVLPVLGYMSRLDYQMETWAPEWRA